MIMNNDAHLSKIKAILKKFPAEELAWLIPKNFPSITWPLLKREIQLADLQFSANNIVEKTMQLIKNENAGKFVTEDILVTLQLEDLIKNKKVTWFAAKLIDKVEDIQFEDAMSLRRSIIRAFRSQALNVACFLTKQDDVVWIALVEKRIVNKKGIRNCPPSFFAVRSNLLRPNIFYYPNRVIASNSFTLFVKGLGYESAKSVSLSGKDVPVLFDMLNRKYDPNFKHQVPTFEPEPFVDDGILLDYTLGKEREAYAYKLLPGTTKIYSYTIEAENEWKGEKFIPEMIDVDGDNKVKTGLTISSRCSSITVEDIFRRMISLGMVTFPVPNYISNFEVAARNRSFIRKRKTPSE